MKTFCVCCRKLYWVDVFYSSVHVMELDGRYKKKLLSGEFTDGNATYIISRPRAVAVNPKYGYWHTHSHPYTYIEALDLWLTPKPDVYS